MAFSMNLGGRGGMGGRDIGGYVQDGKVDSSVVDQIKDSGFIVQSTGMNGDAVQNSTTPVVQSTPAGNFPAYKDAAGNTLIVDEKNTVYTVSTAPIPLIPTPTPTPIFRPQEPVFTGGGVFNGGGGGNGGGIGTPAPGGGIIVPPGGMIGSGKIYSTFTSDDIVPNQQEIVTRALWSNDAGTLTTFFTSSLQSATQKTYYYEVYNSSSIGACGAEAQFSVAYGNIFGSGSEDQGGQIEDTPSRAIYGQYRLLCLDPQDTSFVIDGTTANSIYVINVNRARMREYLDEGNIEINLAHLSGSEYVAGGGDPDTYTGSAVTLAGNDSAIRLIDDSVINSATIKNGGEVYNIVSGTIENGVYNPAAPHIYGQLFRRKGIIVLNAEKLDATASFGTVTGREINGDNAFKLFTSISGSGNLVDGSNDPLGFKGRGAEKVKSTHYFVRAKNADYNFSNNPTFVTGSEGDLKHPEMVGDPKTYITTIGLYNPTKDLIAVAKLSQPVKKSFKEEALIKVKLDF